MTRPGAGPSERSSPRPRVARNWSEISGLPTVRSAPAGMTAAAPSQRERSDELSSVEQGGKAGSFLCDRPDRPSESWVDRRREAVDGGAARWEGVRPSGGSQDRLRLSGSSHQRLHRGLMQNNRGVTGPFNCSGQQVHLRAQESGGRRAAAPQQGAHTSGTNLTAVTW